MIKIKIKTENEEELEVCRKLDKYLKKFKKFYLKGIIDYKIERVKND